MLNPWLLLALGIAWVSSLVGAFHFGTTYEEGQEARTKVAIAQAVDAKAKADQKWTDDLAGRLESRFDKLRIINTTIQKDIYHDREIQTRVLDNPDCALPLSTLRLLNRKRGFDSEAGGEEGSGASQPALEVPADGKAEGATAGGASPAR